METSPGDRKTNLNKRIIIQRKRKKY